MNRLLLVAGLGSVLAVLASCSGDVASQPARQSPGTSAPLQTTSDPVLTPMDQGTSEADLAITSSIRKSLMADPTMSVNARNIKIITRDRMVTLRGVVETPAERTAIITLATAAAGPGMVADHLSTTP